MSSIVLRQGRHHRAQTHVLSPVMLCLIANVLLTLTLVLLLHKGTVLWGCDLFTSGLSGHVAYMWVSGCVACTWDPVWVMLALQPLVMRGYG